MYKLNHFNFNKRKNKYILTNDIGRYSFLKKEELLNLVKRKPLNENLKKELIDKSFIYDVDNEIFAQELSPVLRCRKQYIFSATSLHIFVVTKNCNFNCIYCQAGNLNENESFNMNKDIAKKAVDIALQSPNRLLNFEFQGGEPLLNFEIIKYIVEYSNEVKGDKIIQYNIVSNLSLLNNEMLEFIKLNNIMICTSIDGDRELQNINRVYNKMDSYDATINNLNKLKKEGISVSAIETTTKYSLKKYKEIIDEYVSLGFNDIFIRPLTQLGKADVNWEKIGYSAEEFIEFYKNSLKYILYLNQEKGIDVRERHTILFLKKILTDNDINYMELRSPCGGAIGQIAYYYNGDVYTCDEARMISEMGNNSFLLGNVNDNQYSDFMNSPITKTLCIASCLENLPKCHSCAYAPYCGVCPVINMAQEGNIFSRNSFNYRCQIYKGILDTLFDYIENNDEEIMNIFNKWAN
ncbi:MAG: His-Xaa-Ser system radical SAM maturase HxsB [Clostridia bacterium]|nr:His-Xaa-Ser system radical SAM maturase HxsB [Clostridia bacterium]